MITAAHYFMIRGREAQALPAWDKNDDIESQRLTPPALRPGATNPVH
ncbi:hypothetical protein ABH922_005522 [Rhodococcus sp. 27YEA15]